MKKVNTSSSKIPKLVAIAKEMMEIAIASNIAKEHNRYYTALNSLLSGYITHRMAGNPLSTEDKQLLKDILSKHGELLPFNTVIGEFSAAEIIAGLEHPETPGKFCLAKGDCVLRFIAITGSSEDRQYHHQVRIRHDVENSLSLIRRIEARIQLFLSKRPGDILLGVKPWSSVLLLSKYDDSFDPNQINFTTCGEAFTYHFAALALPELKPIQKELNEVFKHKYNAVKKLKLVHQIELLKDPGILYTGIIEYLLGNRWSLASVDIKEIVSLSIDELNCLLRYGLLYKKIRPIGMTYSLRIQGIEQRTYWMINQHAIELTAKLKILLTIVGLDESDINPDLVIGSLAVFPVYIRSKGKPKIVHTLYSEVIPFISALIGENKAVVNIIEEDDYGSAYAMEN